MRCVQILNRISILLEKIGKQETFYIYAELLLMLSEA